MLDRLRCQSCPEVGFVPEPSASERTDQLRLDHGAQRAQHSDRQGGLG
ncbi:MAG: hypothetical protein VYE04_12490 [Pseudomonadota bacterium]|nr:hypothetical protein [Pseudomonadota bacterium]